MSEFVGNYWIIVGVKKYAKYKIYLSLRFIHAVHQHKAHFKYSTATTVVAHSSLDSPVESAQINPLHMAVWVHFTDLSGSPTEAHIKTSDKMKCSVKNGNKNPVMPIQIHHFM